LRGLKNVQGPHPVEVRRYKILSSNPLLLDDVGAWDSLPDVEHALIKVGVMPLEELPNSRQLNGSAAWEHLRDLIESAGYDSVVYANRLEDRGSLSYIVWDRSMVQRLPDAKIPKHLKTASGTVPILVLPAETVKYRKKFPGFKDTLIVGKFLASVSLYRIFDFDEFLGLMYRFNSDIKGGTFAIPAERTFGASWSGSLQDALDFGTGWKSRGRLKGQLYIAEIDGNGKTFSHLAPNIDPIFDGFALDNAFQSNMHVDSCRGELGCSVVHVRPSKVKTWYRVDESGHPEKVSVQELQAEFKEWEENRKKEYMTASADKTAATLTKAWIMSVRRGWK